MLKYKDVSPENINLSLISTSVVTLWKESAITITRELRIKNNKRLFFKQGNLIKGTSQIIKTQFSPGLLAVER